MEAGSAPIGSNTPELDSRQIPEEVAVFSGFHLEFRADGRLPARQKFGFRILYVP